MTGPVPEIFMRIVMISMRGQRIIIIVRAIRRSVPYLSVSGILFTASLFISTDMCSNLSYFTQNRGKSFMWVKAKCY